MNANMFTRARLQLPLTPGERTFLKFLNGAVVSALLAGLAAIMQFLLLPIVNWHAVFLIGGGTIGTTLAFTFQKYFTAQGDIPAATLAGDIGTVIGQKTGVNDVKQGVA